jgi:Kae1-associated kinase Bud32
VLNARNAASYGKTIGALIANLHDSNIIHGDLTTSNMIVNKKGMLFFIDFGLGYQSTRAEDMAVDLHLLRQALESKHNDCWQGCYNECIKSYKANAQKAKDALDRLEKVERRGRNKEKC